MEKGHLTVFWKNGKGQETSNIYTVSATVQKVGQQNAQHFEMYK